MRLLGTLFLLLTAFGLQAQSVFTSGQWYKIGVTETGIYKIDRSFLSSLGISAGQIDPRNLQLYGNGGGGMLPQANSISRSDDPQQVALFASGESDGSFDSPDFFLFFSEGPDQLDLDAEGAPVYEKNIYSDTVYYFLTIGEAAGSRMDTVVLGSGSNPATTYVDYTCHETDSYNQLRSGRRWLGEAFGSSTPSRTFTYSYANEVSDVTAWVYVAATLSSSSSFDVSINGDLLGSLTVEAIENVTYSDKIKYNDGEFQTEVNSTSVALKLAFDGSSSTGGYLDYFILAATHQLAASDELAVVRIPQDQVNAYSISDYTSETYVWDVTDPTDAHVIRMSTAGQFENTADQTRIAIFQGSNFDTPTFFQSVPNQDIKAFSSLDGVIITHPDFLDQAEELASFHATYDGLNVAVVTTRQVYNEFSSGSQDLTAIRDFIRYHYLKDGTIRYALLLGDASYDYKYRVTSNDNYVPVYESHESAHNIFSHSSDDFIGFMDEDEGVWFEGVRYVDQSSFSVAADNYTLEIGIGRLPAKSSAEAQDMVDKIMRYKEASQSLDKWRTQLAYLADDGDSDEHMEQAEEFINVIDTGYYAYNVTRIYLDAYDQSVEPGIDSPVSQAVLEAIDNGVLFLDYMGHGNENQLTDYDELAVGPELIESLTNRVKLPLFLTATCEFGIYDTPLVVSGAEKLILNGEGGAIAMLSSTRPVYAQTNEKVNLAFHENVFEPIDGAYPRLGDVMRLTKNGSLEGLNNRNFALLGDPMIQLNYPGYQIVFDELDSALDTLSALEEYYISGSIMNNGSVVTSFNGESILTLWDEPQEKVTKGDENDPFTYYDQTNALYRGELSVTDGVFSGTIFIPKNTSYNYKEGKMTMYAWDDDLSIDASGGTKNVALGGTSTTADEDDTAPSVTMYMNDESFVSGQTVGTSSLLIAKLSDEHGINISDNGITQGITLKLNDGDAFSVNEYYTADLDTYKSGTLSYPFEDLDAGTYTATIKVSDSYNNSTESTVVFKVSEKSIIRLYDTNLYPNPSSSQGTTTFAFTHDREGEELKITITVYDLHGSVMNQWKYTVDNSPRTIDDLTLSLSSSKGERFHDGIYICRVTVKSALDGASNDMIKRLIIIN